MMSCLGEAIKKARRCTIWIIIPSWTQKYRCIWSAIKCRHAKWRNWLNKPGQRTNLKEQRSSKSSIPVLVSSFWRCWAMGQSAKLMGVFRQEKKPTFITPRKVTNNLPLKSTRQASSYSKTERDMWRENSDLGMAHQEKILVKWLKCGLKKNFVTCVVFKTKFHAHLQYL